MPSRHLQVGDAEIGTFGLVGKALDFPSVRQNDLLDDGQAQSRALLLGGEVRFEDVIAMLWWNARAIISDFELRFR